MIIRVSLSPVHLVYKIGIINSKRIKKNNMAKAKKTMKTAPNASKSLKAPKAKAAKAAKAKAPAIKDTGCGPVVSAVATSIVCCACQQEFAVEDSTKSCKWDASHFCHMRFICLI